MTVKGVLTAKHKRIMDWKDMLEITGDADVCIIDYPSSSLSKLIWQSGASSIQLDFQSV